MEAIHAKHNLDVYIVVEVKKVMELVLYDFLRDLAEFQADKFRAFEMSIVMKKAPATELKLLKRILAMHISAVGVAAAPW